MPSGPKSTRSTRDAALAASWEACGRHGSLDAWVRFFASWDVMPVEVGGVVVGAVFANGPEVHVAVLPENHLKWATPSLYRWAITDRLKRYGKLVTTGKSDNEFIKRAGFKPVGETNGTTLYERS